MNYVYDGILRGIHDAVAKVAVMRAVEMSEVIDELIKRKADIIDVASMKTAYHRLTVPDVRRDTSYRFIITNMFRDETDPPPSGTFLKVASYQEVPANVLGPAYVNARQAALKLRGATPTYFMDVEGFEFEKFVSTGKTLALAARLDISFSANPAFISALLSMYQQRPKEG